MYDKERFEEEVMDSNRRRIKEINKLFYIAYHICVPYFVIMLMIDIIATGVSLISLGLLAVNPLGVILKFLAHAAMLGAFYWSYIKERNGTIAAIAGIALWFLFNLVNGKSDIIVFALSIVWLAAQILCLTKYKELDYLKAQPGYPDFNAIFLHKKDNRRVTDEQIMESFKENKSKKDHPASETYKIPESTVMNDDGSNFMEILKVDTDTLDDKNASGYENHYMDDISIDDITDGKQSPDK